MSDVLIKGMKMPTSEEKCKFFQPALFRAPFCVINGVCHGIDDCPLVPVPSHGRLIDADALLESIKEARKKDPEIEDVYTDDYFTVAEWVASAPTIIEEEGT